MAKRPARRRPVPPFETDELRKSLSEFFETLYTDEDSGATRPIGSFKWGVYIFYDYDGEPIYVGQTKERVSGRVGRHLTNQRTDAVAMSVLDPFEVCEIEVYPLAQFEGVKSKARSDCVALSADDFRAAGSERSPSYAHNPSASHKATGAKAIYRMRR